MKQIAIIIPTFNNAPYLFPCVDSILRYTDRELFKIYIVNNGDPEQMAGLHDNPMIQVIQMKENAGWEGGLIAGLSASTEPYVLFMNDDTLIPSHQRDWLEKLEVHLRDENCAAVGPTSNVVMGRQNIFLLLSESVIRPKFLIGFCMLVKRSHLNDAGGVDATLPGGDDLDLSIRFRKNGRHLRIDRDVFVYHHGFKTGERVEGTPAAGGWNSIQKIERTNFGLINKHGLKSFLDLWAA